MVNLIWLALIVLGIITAACNGRIDVVTKAALDGAQTGVETALSLIAIMAFWLGVMKIAEQAGLVNMLAKLVRPLIRLLYPSVPHNHPAVGAMVMNLSANVLGLGNAATPMGLIAMKELQKLNPRPDTASEAMCTFLAMNTACITIIPSTMIGIRAIYGSTEPTSIVGTTLFATALGMTAAVLADIVLRHLSYRRGGR
ncbi:MAG: spore maturation protein [Peptococcaceae bacterium]|nr:spore maturation protein [Peptococcaceae bacterium]